MKSPTVIAFAVLATLNALSPNMASAQPAPTARDFDAEILDSLRAAKRDSGFEFLGTLSRLCIAPPRRSPNTSDNLPRYVVDPSATPPRENWFAEPAKVYDNLYFVGGKIHTSWALTTSEGIIIIDTIYPYNSEELIIGGLKKLGLDPNDIKYVVISHAHGDHIGGSEILQTRFGAQVVMGGPDWDLVEKYPNRFKTMAPKRNITATDGMKLTLGDTTLNIFLTPGHTEGTLSSTFTAFDNGKPVQVAYSGGTAFNFPTNPPDLGIRNFDRYIAAQQHMADEAAKAGSTVILSNHTEFDNANTRNRMLAGRGDGPHPYELGTDWVQRYFQTMQACARAEQIRLAKEVALGE
jgi:metallo-beta-lactamase class B